MNPVLITGQPGVGKTTLIRRVAGQFHAYQPIGFYTEEIRVNGVRKGFRLISLDGLEQVLAHVEIPGRYRVSRYGVDVEGFERFLDCLDLGHSVSPLIIIDEIGKMECYSTRFKEELTTLLNSSKTMIATIDLKGDAFTQGIKQWANSRLFTVTHSNRDHLVERITEGILTLLRT